MNEIYPIKFKPILKDKIWGGSKLERQLNKQTSSGKCGESWEISGVPGDVSEVANGFLEGNDLNELIEVYMGDLVGDTVYEKFGNFFPLLIKFIDANDDLSIQVHPDDKVAAERNESFGKTEMWYVMDAEKDAKLIAGFNRKTEKADYLKCLNNNSLLDILNAEPVHPKDIFFIPAGRVHAIGAGILLAEIQQTSDITYRIYDYNRTDEQGNRRDLHTDLAVDVIDYTYHSDYKTKYNRIENQTNNTIRCPYFTTNYLKINKTIEREYNVIDSFVIYICTEGEMELQWGTNLTMGVKKGDSILIPAIIKSLYLKPKNECEFLEVYIES